MWGSPPVTLTGFRRPSGEPSTVSPVKAARVSGAGQVNVPGTCTTVSAEDLAAPDSVLVTVCDQPWVTSCSVSVNFELLNVTEACRLSPGFKVWPKSTGAAGYRSYQPKYSGVAPLQYASAPICSTVPEE